MDFFSFVYPGYRRVSCSLGLLLRLPVCCHTKSILLLSGLGTFSQEPRYCFQCLVRGRLCLLHSLGHADQPFPVAGPKILNVNDLPKSIDSLAFAGMFRAKAFNGTIRL